MKFRSIFLIFVFTMFCFEVVLVQAQVKAPHKRQNSMTATNAMTAAITANTTTACKGGTSPIITFTVLAGGAAPYNFYYTLNGVSATSSSSPTGNSATINISTAVVGTTTVILDSVSSGTLPAEKQFNKEVKIIVGDYPVIDFTFNNNECAGANVNFNTIVDKPDEYTYLWDFGDGATSTEQNPIHNFYPVGTTGTQNFTVTLTVTNKISHCSNTKNKIVTIKRGPDTSINSNASLTNYNGFKTFSICESTSQEFELYNASTTVGTNTSYAIDWGDGSPTFSAATWTTLKHTYGPGLWSLKYTIYNGASCDVTIIYKIFVGSNPSVSLGNPGNTDVCGNTPLKFPITSTENNPPGTTYTITFNDGSAPVVYNHPPPPEVSHTFTQTSCGITSSNGITTFDNSFSATIIAQNPCGRSSVNVVPIYVTTPPTAQIKTDNVIGCVNEVLSFSSSSSFLTMAGPSGCIGSKIVWSITPSTGYSLNYGSTLGNDYGSNNYNVWQSGSNTIYPVFTTPGNYIVKMRTGNKCGIDETTYTICLAAPPVPTFTLDKTKGCFPLTVNTDNTTVETNNCGNPLAYRWEVVSYTAGTCGTTSSYTMTNSGTTKNTQITFNNPGVYTLRLAATNNCGTYYSTPLQTVTVTAPPKVTIDNIPDICQTFPETTIKPTAQMINCGNDTPTYEWKFTGGTPASSTNASPGNITYSSAGTYTIELKVTNECGASTTATKTFTIKPTPTLTGTLSNQIKCASKLSDAVHFTSNLVGTLFNWTNNNTQIGLAANGVGDIAPFTLKNTGNTPITAIITVTPTLNGCDGATKSFDITVNPATYFTSQPQSSAVCQNGTPNTLSVTYANGTGTPQYQWHSNTANNNTTGTPIASATASTYVPPTNTVGTMYYYCVLTLTADVCGAITSDVAEVIVSPQPTIDKEPLATQQVCVGAVIQPLTVSAKNGVGTPQYQWYSNTTNSNKGGTPIPGANAASFTPPAFNTVGVYYFYAIITFPASGCGIVTSSTAQVNVIADPLIDTQPIATQSICQNAAPVPLNVVASGGSGSYLYQWYNNTSNSTVGGISITSATSATFTPPTNVVGTMYYYCIVSQSGLGCAVTSAISEVKVIPAPIITSQPQSRTICLGETFTALSVTYKDGVGTPQYQWYQNTVNNNTTGTPISGAANATYTPSAAAVGTVYYYCIITLPTGGCDTMVSNTAAMTVNQYPVISDFVLQIANGATFTVTPVTTPPTDIVPTGTTYTWTMPTITPAGAITGASAQSSAQTSISQTLTNTTQSAATVIYTVTPVANGCVGNTFKITVTIHPPLNIDATSADITCFGAANGSISVNVSGGKPPYTLLWSGPGGFTSTAANISRLLAGNYNLTVTDSQGTTDKRVYTIKEPLEINLSTVSAKNVSCFGDNNGEISINVNGGTPPYKYVWTKDGNPFATTANISNLTPGTYTVSVTDSKNCGPKTRSYTITQPQPIAITLLNKKDLKCFGDALGAISVQVVGGTLKEKSPGVFDYDYTWTGPGGFTNSTKDISNLKAGAYILTVTDSMNCTKQFTATITQPTEIKIALTVKQVSCFGANDGTIKIDLSGGTAPYQIEWSNFAQGTFLPDLGPGTYTVKITDANNCTAVKDIVIDETPFSIRPVVKHISCFGAQDGSITLNVTGTPSLVTLKWDDNPTAGATRNRLKAGTYTVRLSDGSCSITRSFTIVEPLAINVAANVTDAFDCNNPNSGSINLVVSGGTQPYKYDWSNGATTKDLSNISAGTYLLNITDNNGCTFNKEFEIKRPQPLTLSVNAKPDFNCVTRVLKIIYTAQASGGVPPYSFVWSSGSVSGAYKEIMETTQSGIVTLQVTDKLGCRTGYSFTVQVPNVGIDYQMMDCNNRRYSFSALIPYGQPSDYTFLWNFGDGQTSTLQYPEHVYGAPGTYKVTLKMKNSTCETTFEKNIQVVAPPVLRLDKVPVFCIGDSILLHVSGADSYRWFDGSTADSIRIKLSGNYSVMGTNQSGCTSVLNFSAKNFDAYNYTIQSDRNEVSVNSPEIQLWTENITRSDYYWDFGDGNFAAGYKQTHKYSIVTDGYFDVVLKVKNPNGCLETATKRIWIVDSKLKNTFSPNGDGVDDVYMKGWHIKVYNRNGVLMYEGKDGWDGTYKGKQVSNDTYFVILYYPTEKGTKTSTGYVTVIH